MLLPMIGWALTGLVFFIKPGYEGAYEILQLKTYPLASGFVVPANESWEEAKLQKSVLGIHLLVKSNGQSKNIDPVTHELVPLPEEQALTTLFEDTISQNPERYGFVDSIEDSGALTSTGIKIELDWNTLTFTQKGFDRSLIGAMYKIHYLQWTPWPLLNQVLGVFGLFLLMALTFFGLKTYIGR